LDRMGGVPFFVGEEVFPVRDEEANRSRVRLIDVGKVDLVERPIADREQMRLLDAAAVPTNVLAPELQVGLSPGFPVARTGVFGRVASCFSISLSTMRPQSLRMAINFLQSRARSATRVPSATTSRMDPRPA
jgi:hypothetical protein